MKYNRKLLIIIIVFCWHLINVSYTLKVLELSNRNTLYYKMFLSKAELKRILDEPGFKGALFGTDHKDNWWTRDKVYLCGFSYYEKDTAVKQFKLDTVNSKKEAQKVKLDKQMTSYSLSKNALQKLYDLYQNNNEVLGFLFDPFETVDNKSLYRDFIRYEIRPARANRTSFLDVNKKRIVAGTLDLSPPAPPEISK